MAIAPIPAWAKPLVEGQNSHAEKLAKHAEKLEQLEGVYSAIDEATRTVKKIWQAIKWGAPTIISAAVTAGYINGDIGRLLTTIFG